MTKGDKKVYYLGTPRTQGMTQGEGPWVFFCLMLPKLGAQQVSKPEFQQA